MRPDSGVLFHAGKRLSRRIPDDGVRAAAGHEPLTAAPDRAGAAREGRSGNQAGTPDPASEESEAVASG
jgi:hypothetical protein